MEIIGRGFLATNLAELAGLHPGVLVVAAGVSSTHVTAESEFEREVRTVREAVRRCRADGRQIVFVSSSSHAMYGCSEHAWTEDTQSLPTSPYGLHKWRLEQDVIASGVPWLILRLSHLVGRGQRSHQLLPSMIEQISSGQVRVYAGAHRDLLDVRDLVDALDGLLAAGVRDEIVNVASGVPRPVTEIVAGIEARLGVRARREVVSVAPSRTLVSVAKLRKLLPPGRSFMIGADYLSRLLDRYVPGQGVITDAKPARMSASDAATYTSPGGPMSTPL